jgi:hypothetical protein
MPRRFPAAVETAAVDADGAESRTEARRLRRGTETEARGTGLRRVTCRADRVAGAGLVRAEPRGQIAAAPGATVVALTARHAHADLWLFRRLLVTVCRRRHAAEVRATETLVRTLFRRLRATALQAELPTREGAAGRRAIERRARGRGVTVHRAIPTRWPPEAERVGRCPETIEWLAAIGVAGAARADSGGQRHRTRYIYRHLAARVDARRDHEHVSPAAPGGDRSHVRADARAIRAPVGGALLVAEGKALAHAEARRRLARNAAALAAWVRRCTRLSRRSGFLPSGDLGHIVGPVTARGGEGNAHAQQQPTARTTIIHDSLHSTPIGA